MLRFYVSRGGYVVLCLLALVTACGGSSEKTCRSVTDCPSNNLCVGPDDPPMCANPPRAGCSEDLDCLTGERCHAVSDSCSATGVSAMCGAPCTATSCGSGFQCNSDMACEPIPCGSDHPCPSYQHCDPSMADNTSGPVFDETDGCEDVECMIDSDCSGQVCLGGYCQTSLGTCKPISAM